MKITGAEAIVRSLEKLGVVDIFGIPGGATLPLYDALANSKTIRHYLMRHEQCAAHAADGYARATGRVGVCMATSGPGATNLVTGIANAYMDSIPIVAITGQVATKVIGTDAFQEADITGITLPIVKHSYLITDASEIPQVIAEAFYLANTGRKGPVVIDIPRDVQMQPINFKFPENISLPGYKPTVKGHARQIKQAVEALMKSERPVLFVGGGVISSNASEELRELAEALEIPVIWTLMGKGAFPDEHRLNLGMIGMHGTKTSNTAIQNCDLIFAIGVRFDDRATGNLSKFAPHAEIIHIDIDPAEIGKNVRVEIPIVGDARNVLKEINRVIREKGLSKKNHISWIKQVLEWKEKWPLKIPESEKLTPQYLIKKISDYAKGRKTIFTTGVGQHQMWSAQFLTINEPRRFITSGGLGTMGFGLPAAIGAQVGQPDALVVDIDGDGSFQMVLQDLGTIARYGLPVKVIITNNRYLGMVRQWQELFYGRRYFAVDLEKGTPDFVKLADAYGIAADVVESPSELGEKIETMINHDGPFILDARVHEEENVFPMVPAGASLDEIIGGD
jgi:acetolactate synthase-1/2/3 large subunit